MIGSPAPLRLLIGENNSDLAMTLRMLLEGEPDIRVLGASGSGRELLRMAGETDANAFIVDFSLDDGSSLPVVTALRQRQPAAAIVVFTGHRNPVLNQQCMAAGADAVVVKTGDIDELTSALRAKVGAGSIKG